MKDIYSYCQGESHKSNGKPCQDCAFSLASDSFSMAIVSDGHGGERYFRSQIGSQIVVDVIKESLESFVKNLSKSTQKKSLGKALFSGMPFVQYPAQDISSLTADNKRQNDYIHDALTRLFSSIISQWNLRIALNAEQEPLTDWEKANVPQKYLDEFEVKRNDPTSSLEKFYGCTFMAYVQTNTYWFAFHLGDGKCVMFDICGDEPRFSQPIPWDERCFLNKTTSICDSDPLSEIRYCYCGDGTFPEAMFLGSDGIDDSFGDGDVLSNFYIQIYQTLATKGENETKQELDKSLPIISQKGSKDDMSVACIYNDGNLAQNNIILNKYQIDKLERQLESVWNKYPILYKRIEDYYTTENLSDKDKIDCHYAEIDWRKTVDLEAQICKKLSKLGVEKTIPARSLPNKSNEEVREIYSVAENIKPDDKTSVEEKCSSIPIQSDIKETFEKNSVDHCVTENNDIENIEIK